MIWNKIMICTLCWGIFFLKLVGDNQHMGNGESTSDDPPTAFQHYPPSYAGSSMDAHHQHQPHTSYIADNFTSLDQVFTVT